jgi:hypothetical protein
MENDMKCLQACTDWSSIEIQADAKKGKKKNRMKSGIALSIEWVPIPGYRGHNVTVCVLYCDLSEEPAHYIEPWEVTFDSIHHCTRHKRLHVSMTATQWCM